MAGDVIVAASSGHHHNNNGRDGMNYHSFAEANRIYNDTRISRIRAALFGEPSTSDTQPTRSTIVDKLTAPAQKTKEAVVRLLQFEGSTDVNYMGVPELIKMMCESDEALMAQAVHRVYLLSKEDRTIVTYPNLIDGLLRAARSDDPNVRRDAAGALSHLSEKKEGCVHIFRSGGLAELIRMLYNSVESVVHYAVTTLRNLLIYIGDVKNQARSLGAIDALSALLCRSNVKLLAQVTDSIYYLLLDDPQSKLVFLSRGGPQTLMQIVKNFSDYRKLVYTVIRCIRSLSVCPQNKAALISLGCLPVLFAELRKSNDNKTRLAILVSMRNLSDAATNEENLSELVIYLLDLLRDTATFPEPLNDSDSAKESEIEASSMSACACGILSNLTCNNIRNKETICRSLGMEALLAAISRFIEVEEITEPALCAIRHCTARHALSTQAQNELRLCNSFPTILSLLATFRTPVIKAALGVIRNAALLPANLAELTQVRIDMPEGVQSIVSLTVTIFAGAVQEFREDTMAERDGVPMWSVMEGAVAALHQLAAHPDVATELYSNPDVLALVSELLSRSEVCRSDDEMVERELLGLLYQLSKSPEGGRAVEMAGFTEQLMDALRSEHRSVSTYASGVLKNLQNDRPMHYRQDLDQELASGWQRDGLEPELFGDHFGEMYPVHGIDSAHYEMTNSRNSAWFDTDL